MEKHEHCDRHPAGFFHAEVNYVMVVTSGTAAERTYSEDSTSTIQLALQLFTVGCFIAHTISKGLLGAGL